MKQNFKKKAVANIDTSLSMDKKQLEFLPCKPPVNDT